MTTILILAGRLRRGSPISFTVTLKLPVAVLPALSAAEQSTVVVPNGKVLPEAGVQLTETAPFTMSVADAEKVTTAPAGLVTAVVISAGKDKEGAVVSTTVTSKLPVAVLPVSSVAEQFTGVVPRAKVLPETGEQITGTELSAISVANGAKVATAPAELVASTVIVAGKDKEGGVVSTTATSKLPLAVLPAASVAEQFTGVVPRAKALPETGVQSTATEPETMSFAEGE